MPIPEWIKNWIENLDDPIVYEDNEAPQETAITNREGDSRYLWIPYTMTITYYKRSDIKTRES